MFTTDELDIIKGIIEASCKREEDHLSRKALFHKFATVCKPRCEEYNFITEISRLINLGTLGNVRLKNGRNGGIVKVCPDSLQEVCLVSSNGIVSGKVTRSKLKTLIEAISPTTKP